MFSQRSMRTLQGGSLCATTAQQLNESNAPAACLAALHQDQQQQFRDHLPTAAQGTGSWSRPSTAPVTADVLLAATAHAAAAPISPCTSSAHLTAKQTGLATTINPGHMTEPSFGICFHSPSTTSSSSDPDSESGAAGDSSSGDDSCYSKGKPKGAAAHPANLKSPGTAVLLCDSPGLSAGSSPTAALPAGFNVGAAGNCRPDGRTMHLGAGCRTGSGMNCHQLETSSKPSFTLPSLHSMLGSSAGARKAVAAAGTAAGTSPMVLHSSNTQQDSMPAASKASSAAGASAMPSSGNASAAAAQHMHASLVLATPAAPAPAPSVAAATSSQGHAQAFLHACASPASVAALAALAHSGVLPVSPAAPEVDSNGKPPFKR